MIISRVSPSWFLPSTAATAGILTVLMVFARDYRDLYALRFCMGIFQAVSFYAPILHTIIFLNMTPIISGILSWHNLFVRYMVHSQWAQSTRSDGFGWHSALRCRQRTIRRRHCNSPWRHSRYARLEVVISDRRYHDLCRGLVRLPYLAQLSWQHVVVVQPATRACPESNKTKFRPCPKKLQYPNASVSSPAGNGYCIIRLLDWQQWVFFLCRWKNIFVTPYLYLFTVIISCITFANNMVTYLAIILNRLGFPASEANYASAFVYAFNAVPILLLGSVGGYCSAKEIPVFWAMTWSAFWNLLVALVNGGHSPASVTISASLMITVANAVAPIIFAWANDIFSCDDGARAIVIAIMNSCANLFTNMLNPFAWDVADAPDFCKW